jgi:hypothetical protein
VSATPIASSANEQDRDDYDVAEAGQAEPLAECRRARPSHSRDNLSALFVDYCDLLQEWNVLVGVVRILHAKLFRDALDVCRRGSVGIR